jgi:predicted membrane metal-binding protein
MLGKINGKIINYTNVLLLILLIVFMINPLVVVYDLGFHLSFLSIVALIYILPIIQAYFKCNNKNLDLVFNIFSATIAIMVLLMPYLMY